LKIPYDDGEIHPPIKSNFLPHHDWLAVPIQPSIGVDTEDASATIITHMLKNHFDLSHVDHLL